MSAIVVLLLIASVLFLFVRLRSGETLSFETTADPHRTIAALLGLLAAKRGWQTVSKSERGAHFECHEGANTLIALMLLLCFLLPGIVYIVLTRRRESLVVSVGSAGAGTFVRVASNGRRGKAVGRVFRRHVGFAAALGTCVNAVSRRPPSTLQRSASPLLVDIISAPELPVVGAGIDAAVPPRVWRALDDRVLVGQELHG
jgi:hypothetical protein